MSFGKFFAGALGLCLVASSANADVFINEILGSTSGSDAEFIEIYNSGPGSVDLSDIVVELWESDAVVSPPGSLDGGSPYALSGILAPGGFYSLGNANAVAEYGSVFDGTLPANAVENSSYTAVLWDTANSVILDSVFVTDGGAGDTANREGAAITPAASIGPDGSFLPAGFFRTTDGGSSLGLLNFSRNDLNNGTPQGGTPGATNVPEPTSVALVLFGLAGVCFRRR